MEGCTEREATEWRERAKGLLKGPTIDPVTTEPGLLEGLSEWERAVEIVEGDIVDIQRCDVLLQDFSLLNRQYIGTAFETRIGYMQGKMVVAVHPEGHPWLTYHCDAVFRRLEDACEFINRM